MEGKCREYRDREENEVKRNTERKWTKNIKSEEYGREIDKGDILKETRKMKKGPREEQTQRKG